jgi:hypothetical protein
MSYICIYELGLLAHQLHMQNFGHNHVKSGCELPINLRGAGWREVAPRVKRTRDGEIEPPAKRMKGKSLAVVGLKQMDKIESSESLGPRRNPTRNRKATPVQKSVQVPMRKKRSK